MGDDECLSRSSPSHLPTCSLCGEAYEEPRLLPCLHTYCARCIDNLHSFIPTPPTPRHPTQADNTFTTNTSDTSGYKSSTSSTSTPTASLRRRRHNNNKSIKNWRATCPTCENEFKLDQNGASGLPLNSLLQNRSVTSTSQSTSGDVTACDFCISRVNAVAFCVECRVHLCAFCVEAHKRQRKTNAHSVTSSLDDATHEPGRKWTRLPRCQRHHTEEVTSYCDNCSTTVCNECVARGEHKTHRHVIITRDVTEEKIKELRKRLSNLTGVAQRFRDALDDVCNVSKSIRARETEVRQEVNKFYEVYAGALEQHRKILLNKLIKERDFKLNLLQIQRIQLEQALNDVDTSRHFAQQLLLEGSPIEILTLIGHVTERINDVTSSNSHVTTEARADDWLQFLPEEINHAHPANDAFQIKGDVTSQRICPAKCYIKGNEMSGVTRVVGQKVEVVLIVKDSEGQSMTRGGHNLKVELMSKDKQKQYPKRISVVDRKDGTYLITIICPDEPGVHLLSIRIEDEHVQGSPFPLPVKVNNTTKPNHQGIFHCCCFCSSGGSKQAQCGCRATMPGGFKGCGHGHEGHPGRKHWSCCGNTEQHSKCSLRKCYQATL